MAIRRWVGAEPAAILRKCELCGRWRSIEQFNRLSHRCMDCLVDRYTRMMGTEEQAYWDPPVKQ